MMEHGEQFWGSKSSSSTDWKTRKAQQDAYRKALDEQIQHKKTVEQSLKEKVKETPQPVVKEPMQRLMSWLPDSNESQRPGGLSSKENNAYRSDVDRLIDNATAVPPKQQLPPVAPAPPKNGQQQGQAYFYGPPSPAPSYTQVSSIPNCTENQPSGDPTSNNKSASIPHPNNVAYGYYQSSSIPPPPGYTEPKTTYRPDFPYKTNNQNNNLRLMEPPHPTNIQQQATVDSQNASQMMTTVEKSQPMVAEESKQDGTAWSAGKNSTAGSVEMSVRRHVSQTSEETPSQAKNHYRDELSRQIEERKKFDEERRRQERLEEERLQRKVQEDQERMTREYEEEQRRRKAKEDEKRQAEEDILQRTREAQQQEELRRKHEKEEKRRSKELALKAEASEERLNAKLLAANTLENPFDSTPIPRLITISAIRQQQGQGDSEVIKTVNLQKKTSPVVDHDEIIASAGTSNILTQKTLTSGLSKSVEECHVTPSSFPLENIEGDACSKCACKSYSSDDIKLRQEAELKQMDGVKFLNRLRSVLVAEKEKIDQCMKARKDKEDAYNAKAKRCEFTVQF